MVEVREIGNCYIINIADGIILFIKCFKNKNKMIY